MVSDNHLTLLFELKIVCFVCNSFVCCLMGQKSIRVAQQMFRRGDIVNHLAFLLEKLQKVYIPSDAF